MKELLVAMLFASAHVAPADEPVISQQGGSTLHDPRQPVTFHTMFEAGEEPKSTRTISNSIMIICWMPAPDGTFGRYQISGIDGYHTKEQVERFLIRFYDANHQTETKSDDPNIILAGNNWGAGHELRDALKSISGSKSIGVFYVGGWAFTKVSLIPEPELRKKLIERSFAEANE